MVQVAENYFQPEELGQRLRERRLASEYEIEQAAQFVHLDSDAYTKFEIGEAFPSLVELETLAYYFNILPEFFWETDETSSTDGIEHPAVNYGTISRIRRRSIGLAIRKFRLEAGLSTEQLAEALGIESQDLETMELGETDVPLDKLFMIAEITNHTPREFLDRKSPIGAWAERSRINRQLEDLPDDLKEFAAKPINRPFLVLARRLSEMPVQQLREIAEGILEITL